MDVDEASVLDADDFCGIVIGEVHFLVWLIVSLAWRDWPTYAKGGRCGDVRTVFVRRRKAVCRMSREGTSTEMVRFFRVSVGGSISRSMGRVVLSACHVDSH